jgi:OH-DDVA oxygenase
MAEIVLGMWTSHGPTLSTTPEQWSLRVPFDKSKPDHPFRGRTYDFPSLVTLRRDENLAAQSSMAEREKRSLACTQAVSAMADAFQAAKPDVAVIMGNDQHELFLDDVIPAITVFHGPTIWDQPADEAQAARMPAGIHEAEWGHTPPKYTEYPGHPDLAAHLIRAAVAGGYDVATSKTLPNHPGHWTSGIEFGKLGGKAIRSWPANVRVAVFGSGGMSHFVIDEALDQRIFTALRTRDAELLCTIEESVLQSGSSELKNWIAAAGVLFDTPLKGDVVGYQPCYRSEAGTGTANGFVCWR